jgi:hypothetical protein
MLQAANSPKNEETFAAEPDVIEVIASCDSLCRVSADSTFE